MVCRVAGNWTICWEVSSSLAWKRLACGYSIPPVGVVGGSNSKRGWEMRSQKMLTGCGALAGMAFRVDTRWQALVVE